MKYLFIDASAADYLTLNKQYQAHGFDRTKELLLFIKGEKKEYFDGYIEGLFDIKTQGLILLTKESRLTKGIIIDLETFDLINGFTDQQIITIFQKILKFYKRHSSGNVFSSSERILSNDRAIIFPFPFSTSDSYRILIDRNPYAKRLNKREAEYIQIFTGGTNSNNNTVPLYNSVRKFFEEKENIKNASKINKNNASTNPIVENAIKTVNLNASSYSIDGSLQYDEWLQHLTSNQKKFVSQPFNGPERLEGAAGTGKTLSLILKTITQIKYAIETQTPFRIIFITHTTSTKNQIIERFQSIFPEIAKYIKGNDMFHYLEVNTLNDWCISNLGQQINESQLLERDAQDSKTHQYLLLEEIFSNTMSKDFPTYKNLISPELKTYLENSEKESIIEMLQFEIGITIKGKAEEDFEKYQDLLSDRSPFSIPAKTKHDLDFLFLVYSEYKSRLSGVDQYDVDDIVLSSLGSLKTPIWRRRRSNEGYDYIVVDESHLFNFNELSVFHNLLKDENSNNIIFAIDKSQAVGDRGLTNDAIAQRLNISKQVNKNKYSTVFRSSPDIVNLAYTILCSGTSLFLERFENPLDSTTEFTFTQEEEAKTEKPMAFSIESYDKMISYPFSLAEQMAESLTCTKDNILIVGCSDSILDALQKFAKETNKPCEVLKKRGDFDVLKSAKKSNRYIIGGIDFVGGLEFQAVILVGTDKGRVPPSEQEKSYSFHFVNYAWHNRLYVAITRAKYRIALVYEKSRGLSPILTPAVNSGYLESKTA